MADEEIHYRAAVLQSQIGTEARRRPKSINEELEALETSSSTEHLSDADDLLPQQPETPPANAFPAASLNIRTMVEGFARNFAHELKSGDLNTVDSRYAVQRERVSNFLKVPMEIEKLMLYGYFICLDSFLSILTTFPLRFLHALFISWLSIFTRYSTQNSDHFMCCMCALCLVWIIINSQCGR